MEQVVFLTVNHRGPLPLREIHSTEDTWCGETLGDLEPVYDLALPEALTKTCMWRFSETGRFSYGESPCTPPLEGNLLHQRNNSVERPWEILSLFTTCFR